MTWRLCTKTALDYIYLLNYTTVLNVILTCVNSKQEPKEGTISFRSFPDEAQVCLPENSLVKRPVHGCECVLWVYYNVSVGVTHNNISTM